MSYTVTVPPTEYDPDLVNGDKPLELPFVAFWAIVMQSQLWDSENNETRISAGVALRGRVRVGCESFKLSMVERTHVLDVMAKMDLNPALRQLVRGYRLAVLRAKED